MRHASCRASIARTSAYSQRGAGAKLTNTGAERRLVRRFHGLSVTSPAPAKGFMASFDKSHVWHAVRDPCQGQGRIGEPGERHG